MQYLLSLPENLVADFHQVTNQSRENWFVASDPVGKKIGSGGGTAYLLAEHQKDKSGSLDEYLATDKKVIIHAGGQSRRLPAYAPVGKVLAPIPVFRWSRGQSLDQALLDLQRPLLEKVMSTSGAGQNTVIASGDVLIQSADLPFKLPEADVVCLGIWVNPHLASRHGVFFTSRQDPGQLDFMLQKPNHEQIEKLAGSHLFMMDIGIWLLSDRAVKLLMKKSGWKGDGFKNGCPDYYDLYSAFGTCLGENPSGQDQDISQLSVAIVPLDKGEFYHYGTSRELISSTEKIQNRVQDQRSIWHNRVKPHPSLFVQNARTEIKWNAQNRNIWIENSHIPAGWQLNDDHIITGVPGNDWELSLPPGICLDIIPIGEDEICIRPYGMDDPFRGELHHESTVWMGKTLRNWFVERGINFKDANLEPGSDMQSALLFPVIHRDELTQEWINWMINDHENVVLKDAWLTGKRFSADDISAHANMFRLHEQRLNFRRQSLHGLAKNYRNSVFYQANLKQIATDFVAGELALPDTISKSESPLIRFRDQMFRSEVLKNRESDGFEEEKKAFAILQETIVNSVNHTEMPSLNVFFDQIIWGRSPARLDLAGGWADTPPFCMQNGGSVINLAVELNGQPPIQAFIRLSGEKKITLRSIDNGVSEVITSYEELKNFNQVGSSFSIPKAALCLAGFHPDYCGKKYLSLTDQLSEFGGGFEISMLAAIPKGSGLGTSSILAATLLGTLSDFCNLSWDQQTICHRTLILEQLLTTGGGWQDQYGGILPGVKLLESMPGTQEKMSVRWLPDTIFTKSEFKDNWLLYYTGITRVAKNILKEIVHGMFLNEGSRLSTLNEIKEHAYRTTEAIEQCDFEALGRMIAHSWELNKKLDPGTITPEVAPIVNLIKDHALGLKLLGAGGGGYLLICAKDREAAGRIRTVLTNNPPNDRARFVKMDISQLGFQVSRS
ncbi:MAG: bifunctional fucokinase/L-fucose-1-P-guanylyltransferase [Marinilabiliaceae bacterium]|nr:bifunctional fucokinase/L-fucose-1-P-guanylyltransferase [Marinilabiliaceae bacterium]